MSQLAAQSHDDDTIIVEMIYCGKFVRFDMPFMQVRYLPIEEIVRRYFMKAFTAIDVPAADLGETRPSALSSSEITG